MSTGSLPGVYFSYLSSFNYLARMILGKVLKISILQKLYVHLFIFPRRTTVRNVYHPVSHRPVPPPNNLDRPLINEN
jgi:hypothetical protein